MGNASLPEALRGVALRPVLLINQLFNFDKEKGIIPEKNPGLQVELLDKICERAGCTWRDSYGVIEKPANKTFDELLHWSIEKYDISITWWAESLERMEVGVGFMEPWYNADIVMVKKRTDSRSSLMRWMRPFTSRVWFLIAVTIVASGVVYWILKLLDPDTDESKVKKNPSSSIFLASIAFTSQFDFHPLTHAGRIFAFSISLWAFLIGNSYVANLTSFLVTENRPETTMSAIVQKNRPVCIRSTSQQDTAILRLHPTVMRKLKVDQDQVYQGVLDGDCTIGITTFSDWDESKNREINTNCNLEIVGPVIERHDGGFATLADTGDKCTSLIRDVLGYHLSHIENDNPAEKFRTNAWERHIELRKDQDCTGNIEEDIGNRLKFTHVSSIFFFHGVLTAFALCLALLIWRLRKRETRNKNTNQHSNLRKTLQGKEKGVLQRSLETSFAMSNNISDATKEEDRIIIDQMRNIVKEEVKEHVQDLDTKVSEVLRLLRIFIT